jgi:hypothetical protein
MQPKRKYFKISNEETAQMASLLVMIDNETRIFGRISYSGLKAYAKGYGIKPKELETILQKMKDLKLIVET